ncbi:MAG: spermidine/putrescine transporter substrate-binding protein [Ilumatobacteraceae bacterium]|nr:spermidine/putrescine transporter substrate-binding protein [Ilumatobacteraceae bacterium]
MSSSQEPVRILAPHSLRETLSRRALLQVGAGSVGLAALLAACGSDKKTSSGSTATTASTAATSGSTAGTTAAGGSTAGTTAAGGIAGYSEVVNKSSGTLAMYTWGDYNDPSIVGDLAQTDLGITMKVDYYTSNEDLITKLSTANGSSGFDVVVPTGPYIPQMIQKGLLEKFDKDKLPNLVNVDPLYLGQDWDKGNDYSVCKDWGSTGWMWDSTKVKADIKTWNDFITAATGEASGNVSVLDTGANVLGMYCWANGLDWNTTSSTDLDAAEKFLVDTFASHIKAFDSYPSTKIAEGAYTLSMAWNGDARQAYSRISDAGGNPDDWKWALGTPNTELWMDNYCIAAGSPNPDAAHAWINWLLTPEISIKDLQYHGYNSGMKGMEALIAKLAPDLKLGNMIFFSDDQVKTMRTQKITSAQDRIADIYNKIKAKAGG